MSLEQTRNIEFSQPFRQIISMVLVLVFVAVGIYFLYGPISTVFNANQADADGNGVGDACEPG